MAKKKITPGLLKKLGEPSTQKMEPEEIIPPLTPKTVQKPSTFVPNHDSDSKRETELKPEPSDTPTPQKNTSQKIRQSYWSVASLIPQLKQITETASPFGKEQPLSETQLMSLVFQALIESEDLQTRFVEATKSMSTTLMSRIVKPPKKRTTTQWLSLNMISYICELAELPIPQTAMSYYMHWITTDWDFIKQHLQK